MSQAHCDVCGVDQPTDNQQPGPLWLGQHKRRVHDIAGSSPTTAKRTRRKARGPSGDRAPRDKGATRQPSLASDLKRTFKVIGGLVRVVDPYCGTVIATRSDEFCAALAQVAASDPRIARWLRSIGKAGPYGALVISSANLAIPIAAHHGLLPRELAALAGASMPPEREPSESSREVAEVPTRPSTEYVAPQAAPRESVPLVAEG